MTANPPRRRSARVLAASVLLAGVGALAACSAGQITQTSSQVAAVPGVNASACVDPKNCRVALRNVMIAYQDPAGYPAGGAAPLVVRLFNQDNMSPIALVRVEAPEAANAVVLAGGSATAIGSTPEPVASASASASASTSAAASASASASATPSAAQTLNIVVPPAGYTLLVPGTGPYLVLSGLKKPILPGDLVHVSFVFSDDSKIDVMVTTGPPVSPAPRSPLPLDENHE